MKRRLLTSAQELSRELHSDADLLAALGGLGYVYLVRATSAAYGGFRPAPASRSRGTYPHLSRRLLRHTKIREPQTVRRGSVELPVHVIQRTESRLVADRCPQRFAPDRSPKAHILHQPGDRAASGAEAFPPQLPPDLAHIAMEAAASLFGRGLSVDVIAPGEHPLEKVFGRELSDLVLEAHARAGVRLHLGFQVARIEDKQVLLQGGERINTDIVVVGVGAEPRLQPAEAAGLVLDRGVVVNSRLQTSDHNIFAAGDIARWPDPHSGESIRVEHWVVAERQGQVAAANMLGNDEPFTMVPFFWTKHFDLSIRYVGHAEKWDETRVEGDLAHRDGLVRFRRAERDKKSLRAELGMEGQFQRSA